MKAIRHGVPVSVLVLIGVLLLTMPTAPQTTKPPSAEQKTVVFAIIHDGTTIEPIGFLSSGKMEDWTGDSMKDEFLAFKPYFAPGTTYDLIFGGAKDGSITVKQQHEDPCSGISAEVAAKPQKARLKGFVMALAANTQLKAKTLPVRRLPTLQERSTVEKLVRAEFRNQKVAPAAVKDLRYHNLTAIDIDGDGTAEFVGTFWLAPKATERNTLFVIVENTKNGSLQITHGEYNRYSPDEVMSGDLKDLDEGIYHNLLLDYLDIDGDGVAEIFTTAQAFEGRNFKVYKRSNNVWDEVFSSYNYRCGY